MKRLFRLFVLSLVLVMIALLSMLITMRLAIHRSETAVPQLVGLVGAGFEFGLDGECDLEREWVTVCSSSCSISSNCIRRITVN